MQHVKPCLILGFIEELNIHRTGKFVKDLLGGEVVLAEVLRIEEARGARLEIFLRQRQVGFLEMCIRDKI